MFNMHFLRLELLCVMLLLGCGKTLMAEMVGVPLNDFTRLGQRFTIQHPLGGIWIIVPSWHDSEGGLTLTLWDSPKRQKQLAQKTFKDIPDNARIELLFPKSLQAGTYYWEVHDRTGETRVGLYADMLKTETEDCAYLEGKPDRKRRFVFGTLAPPFVYNDVSKLIAVLKLKSNASIQERMDACRQLAVVGNRQAIQVLADLLTDEKLSHMARYALEPMPDPKASDALRAALKKVKGQTLIGIINSLGARRDVKAVKPLSKFLEDPDATIASAAAVALGKIGNLAAARMLERALRRGRERANVRAAVYEASLNCAHLLLAQGRLNRAVVLFDLLRGQQVPLSVRMAGLRGAIIARQAQGIPLLVEQLRNADQDAFELALWILQHDFPGAKVTKVTEVIGQQLGQLPKERQIMLIEVLSILSKWGDEKAVAALLKAAREGEKEVRLAAVKALPEVGESTILIVAELVGLMGEADEETARAAQESLARLPGKVVEGAVGNLLSYPQARYRLVGIELVGRQRLVKWVPKLVKVSEEEKRAEVRRSALKVLGELAGASELPALLTMLRKAEGREEIEAVEQVLIGIGGKWADREAYVGKLVEAFTGEVAAQKRASLVRVVGGVGGKKALEIVRAGLRDSDGVVREEAIRVLSEWETGEGAGDLLELARRGESRAERLRCLRGAIRIGGNPEVPEGEREAICKQAAELVEREEEKKLLLGALGGIGSVEALRLAVAYLEQAGTREEASAALVRIAENLVERGEGSKLAEALEKVVQMAKNPDLVKRAQQLLKSSTERERSRKSRKSTTW